MVNERRVSLAVRKRSNFLDRKFFPLSVRIRLSFPIVLMTYSTALMAACAVFVGVGFAHI